MFKHLLMLILLAGVGLAVGIPIAIYPLAAGVYVLGAALQALASHRQIEDLREQVALLEAKVLTDDTIRVEAVPVARSHRAHSLLRPLVLVNGWVCYHWGRLVYEPMWRRAEVRRPEPSGGRHSRNAWERHLITGTVAQRRQSVATTQARVHSILRAHTDAQPQLTDGDIYSWLGNAVSGVAETADPA